jgi:hypothetical protein
VSTPEARYGVVVGVRVPVEVRQHLETLAGGRFGTKAKALRVALANLVDGERPPAAAQKKAKTERMVLVRFRTGAEQVRRLRAHAVAKGHSSVSDAVAQLVSRALDEEEGQRAVPAQKADELADGLRALGAMVEELGPGVLGVLHLLAHWAVKSGSLKVSEDELLAEVFAVGQGQWQQVLEELRRDGETAAGTD